MKEHSQQGVSLIEVMVTVFIISIGLLGVAALQLVSLKQVAATQLGAQAQFLTQDLAELILAHDPEAEGVFEFDSVPDTPGTDCLSVACSKAQLARFDLWMWGQHMQPELPAYDVGLDFDAANARYEVMLTWDSGRKGGEYVASTCSADDGLHPGCFAMYVAL